METYTAVLLITALAPAGLIYSGAWLAYIIVSLLLCARNLVC